MVNEEYLTQVLRLPRASRALRCDAMTELPTFDDIVADFAFLDDWDDRYKYLIDLGRALPAYPEALRDDAHKVKGCASQVWLASEVTDCGGGKTLTLAGDSDAHIVKGLVALMLALFSGRQLSEISTIDAQAALAPLDLENHLTPQRSNGLASMLAKIKSIAETETA